MSQKTEIKKLFENCLTQEEIYQRIMEIGRGQKPFAQEDRNSENLVSGCQSELYLKSKVVDDTLEFEAYSEALISSGLAQILILYYNHRSFEEIIKEPPTFLEELGITQSLTPSRANGLYSVHLKMKQIALKAYIASNRS